jgi:hypothetical protein
MMVQKMMQEEAEAATERKKRLLLLVTLPRLRATLLSPRMGGSAKGKGKNIDFHRMDGTNMLEDDYFKDGATNGPKTFQRRFQMNKETSRKIVQGVR